MERNDRRGRIGRTGIGAGTNISGHLHQAVSERAAVLASGPELRSLSRRAVHANGINGERVSLTGNSARPSYWCARGC